MSVVASVVMPIGAIDEFLPVQIQALAAQDYAEPWQLVLSLNTADQGERVKLQSLLSGLLESCENVSAIIVDSSEVRSAAHARNVGAASAEGTAIVFCDADDIAEPDWLRQILNGLDEFDAVGGHLAEERLAVAGQECWRPPATPGTNPSYLGYEYLVSANMAISAELFGRIGGFDETLLRCEDIALGWDIARQGGTIGFVPGAVVHYRHRRGLRSMMHQHYLYGIGMSQVIRRHGSPNPDGDVGLFAANSQAALTKDAVYFLRRGSIAAGRLVGLIQESIRSR